MIKTFNFKKNIDEKIEYFTKEQLESFLEKYKNYITHTKYDILVHDENVLICSISKIANSIIRVRHINHDFVAPKIEKLSSYKLRRDKIKNICELLNTISLEAAFVENCIAMKANRKINASISRYFGLDHNIPCQIAIKEFSED